MLARGLTAFEYKAGVRGGHKRAEALFCFLGRYLGNVFGVMNVCKALNENKEMTLVYMITSDLYVHIATTLENHEEKWGHQLTAAGELNKEERSKYKNYKDLSPEDQLIYAPKESRSTTGKGMKRESGEFIWSK